MRDRFFSAKSGPSSRIPLSFMQLVRLEIGFDRKVIRLYPPARHG